MIRLFALATAVLIALQARAAGPFDGTWNVTLTCPAATDGALGYTYQFIAEVRSSILHGENGTRQSPSWLTLDGPIQADGTATLAAQGLTGNPGYNVARVNPGIPYSYHVNAKFTGATGAGKRVELRACDLQFIKR